MRIKLILLIWTAGCSFVQLFSMQTFWHDQNYIHDFKDWNVKFRIYTDAPEDKAPIGLNNLYELDITKNSSRIHIQFHPAYDSDCTGMFTMRVTAEHQVDDTQRKYVAQYWMLKVIDFLRFKGVERCEVWALRGAEKYYLKTLSLEKLPDDFVLQDVVLKLMLMKECTNGERLGIRNEKTTSAI